MNTSQPLRRLLVTASIPMLAACSSSLKALFERLGAAERRISELEAKLGEPPKTPDNSSLPPSKAQKINRRDKPRGGGPRQGSLGREGGGRLLACDPDQTVIARPLC